MNPQDYRVRRATLEDVPALQALWKVAQLPAEELEKRFGEFQVIQAADGHLAAAIALQISGKDALIHSETIGDFALADTLRPLLWERITNMSQNHGLYRMWTRESAPYWRQVNFSEPPPDLLNRLPEPFKPLAPGLLGLRLKDEDAIVSIEKEFAMFREAEKKQTEELMETAKNLKTVALIVGILAFFLVLGCTFYLVKEGHLFRR